MKIKMYNTNSTIGFGRFFGKTIFEITEIDPTYIQWCVEHLEHFLISEEVKDAILEKYPTFKFSESFIKIMGTKTGIWQMQNYKEVGDQSSYGKYSGSYAQDYEGLSDDFIDDVLDGFPDAYWNID
jgi:hypothetical protein